MDGAAPVRWLTIEQLCERFQIKLRTARDWRVKGKGPLPVKMGGLLRYPLDEVERYEAELRKEAEESRRNQDTA